MYLWYNVSTKIDGSGGRSDDKFDRAFVCLTMGCAFAQHLKFWVRRPLIPETGHDGGQHSVTGGLARPGGPHQRASETDVEDVEQLNDLPHEEWHLRGGRVGSELRETACRVTWQ